MKKFLLPTLFIFSLIHACAQPFIVVESKHRFKNFKYYEGNDILLKVKGYDEVISGTITTITDSTIQLDMWDVVKLERVECILRRRNAIRYFSTAFLIGGTAYISISTVNRLINDDAPVIPAETAIISGSLIGTGFLLRLFKYRKLDVEKWKVMVLDPGATD